MKDLDFDELDRAVNSLLGSNNQPVEGTPIDGTSTPDADITTQPPASLPLAARRSSGRFMDVVHPSSDMRTPSIPQRPISREGAGVTPPARTPLDTASLVDQSVPLSQSDASPATSEAPKPAASDWPDPIDFNGFSPDETPAVVTEPVVAELPQESQAQSRVDEDTDINQIADDINKSLDENQDSQPPLESPFLTDAKVEKRPLNAFPTESTTPSIEPVQVTEPAVPVTTEAVISNDGEDQPLEVETPLPAELQGDLLLIESSTETEQPKKEEPIAPQIPEQTPQQEAPVGPTSITQQYTEQPSTGDQPTGAIFDTGAYQKPLAHPAKKKSGWLMVLWIALLLTVGAGAGAAVYFFILPML